MPQNRDPATHNAQVLHSLKKFLSEVQNANALLGRDSQRIYIDRRKLPEALRKDPTFPVTYLLLSPDGARGLFSGEAFDQHFASLDFQSLLTVETRFDQGFPYLEEFRALIIAIEPVTASEALLDFAKPQPIFLQAMTGSLKAVRLPDDKTTIQ